MTNPADLSAGTGTDEMVMPDYRDRCLTRLLPALLGVDSPSWLPDEVLRARQVVLFVVDGLGWQQLRARESIAPTLASMQGEPITTVAPSTTASALTSIVTGAAPGEHGMVGYRIMVDGQVLNALRWTTPSGDARTTVVPAEFQPLDPFCASPATVITRSEFAQTGFTKAHLDGAEMVGYRTSASLVHEVRQRLDAGDRLVYAYYDGIDRIGHEYGHGGHYDAELASVDSMVERMTAALPPGAALVVTADHGQIETTPQFDLDTEVTDLTDAMSGEARFRWLHTAPGRTADLAAAATATLGDAAITATREKVLDEGWLGPHVTTASIDRLGEVAVVATGCGAINDPAEGGFPMLARHGGFTPAEMLVPVVSAWR